MILFWILFSALWLLGCIPGMYFAGRFAAQLVASESFSRISWLLAVLFVGALWAVILFPLLRVILGVKAREEACEEGAREEACEEACEEEACEEGAREEAEP